MVKKDLVLFNLLNSKTNKVFSRKFKKYFINDSKKFASKINRDYFASGNFPVHVLKQIKLIDKSKYDFAVCVLRGALPYALLFEFYGWKIHYIICGRRNEDVSKKKRVNISIDRALKQIKSKKVLILENNSPSGETPILVYNKLKEEFNIKKPDLFLDYFYFNKKEIPKWLKKKGAFWKAPKKLKRFGKVYEASSIKVINKERDKLIGEFIELIKK